MLSTRRMLLAIAAVLATAAPAQAAVVARPDSTTLTFTGTAVDDRVVVTIVDSGANVLFDIQATSGQSVTAQSPCAIAAPSATDVKCPRGTISRIVFDLGAGDDSVNNFAPDEIPIRIEADGGPGGDSLRGGSLNDVLSGGDGPDSLNGRSGGDNMVGGGGFDFVSYGGAVAVTASLDDAANDGTVGGAEGDNVHSDIEELSGSSANDVLVGSAHGNILTGREGNDKLDGGGGTDEFFGDEGDDEIQARDGEGERVHCGDGTDVVTADDVDEPADCETFNASGDLVRDLDKDGVSKPDDCDDANPAVRPGLADTPDDGVDQDCDGVDASNPDRDRDGVARPFDCDDANAATKPGAREVYGNKVDEDCNGRADPLQTLQTPVLSRFVAGKPSTTIQRLRAERLDAGTRVELVCTGRACPFKTKAFALTRNTAKLDLRRSARLRRLRGTVTLDVRVLREDSIGRVYRYRFRAGKLPRTQILCQAPADPKPRAC